MHVAKPFDRGLHSASGLTYWPLGQKAFEEALPKIGQIVAEIVTVVYTGSTAVSIDDIKNDIQNLGEAAKQHGFVSSGEHANGWISAELQQSANYVINYIDATKGAYPDQEDFLEILKALMKAMTKLDTQGHDPWLKADWQIGFTGICETAARVMLNPPA